MLLGNELTAEHPRIVARTLADDLVKITLIGDPGGRQRIEIAPLYLPLAGGRFLEIFTRAGQIVADPRGENPLRPIGHCFEDHVSGDTQRWSREDNIDYVRLIEAASRPGFEWLNLYNDGGSAYSCGKTDLTIRRQVSNRTGRTMVGILIPHTLFLFGYKVDPLRIDFDLQYRIVTYDGGDPKYSPTGTTQFAFGRFRLYG